MILAIFSLGLLVRENESTMNNDESNAQNSQQYKMCGSTTEESNIDTSEAEYPGLYDDLTVMELESIQDYMYSLPGLKIVKPSNAVVNSSYIYVSDLHPPKKAEALAFLEGNGTRPKRSARLVVFRGDATPPVVEEYIVGPLPNPTWHKLYSNSARKNPVPYAFRPQGSVEYNSYYDALYPEIDEKIGFLLMESYGATFTDCDKCLGYYDVTVGSGVIGEKTRKIWLITTHHVEFYSLHPLDLMFLVNMNSPDPTKYHVEKILYAGREYSDLDDLAVKYNTTSIPKSKIRFPMEDRNLFSTMNRRGEAVPKEPKRAPRMYEPDGKRYSVKHRTAEYMQWKFNFRMSTLNGPQLNDVKFNNQRIAYEIGLQEIAVFYAANNSASRSADFVDSGALLGTHSQSLVPGADCPETSTFINFPFIGESYEDSPVVLERAFCLFELNTGVPLRRHLSYSTDEGGFYSGLSDNVLILRSILTIYNYDYIIDFIFHQNGALEVRGISTGYVFMAFHTPKESPYGFQLHDNILGTIHHHMFLVKADLDIHGTSNRYETLDITTEEVKNEQTTNDPTSTYFQIRYDKRLKQTEMDAAFKYNFETPKYHIIHNQNYKTDRGEVKAFRIQSNGMTKQLLPPDHGNEKVVAWSRYQMAVTKYKEDEREGTSCYGMFDSLDPTVNFTSFLADDENIVDEDLVFWIPMGSHHIPHTEDIPVVSTVGGHLSVTLLPYNYFPECPSSQSRDSIRVEYKDNPADGLRVERYGTPENEMCVAHAPDFDKEVRENPASTLEYP